MGDPNMNFENRSNISNEDPPPILSSGIREVFHVFASMLDIKSFMRLAMASKEMYERCMNDKMIRINIDEKQVTVRSGKKNPQTSSFCSFNVADKHIEKYLGKLRQLKCNVSLEKILFTWCEVDDAIIIKTRRYLEELGVKKIDSFNVEFKCTASQQLSFIKDFHIKNVEIGQRVSDDAIRYLLQSNLNFFLFTGEIQGELLLEVDTSIPRLEFPFMQLSSDVFTQILWKIQTGALKKLCVIDNNIPWGNFTSVRKEFDGPLPDERPLLITTRDSSRWFLHGDGGVTICKRLNPIEFEISKCPTDDFPVVAQSKESVHKMLAEKPRFVRTIDCMKSHLISFFDGIPVLDASHEGPFPEERPLLCESGRNGSFMAYYYLLEEDGSIHDYNWVLQSVFHECHDLVNRWPTIYSHTPLQKFLFDKRIQNRVTEGRLTCQSMEEFRSLFEDYETLTHDFKGQLPERRPLVFKKSITSGDQVKEEHRVILCEDASFVLYCCDSQGTVRIRPCSPWNLPSIMMSLENFRRIIFYAPLEPFSYKISLDMFYDAFEGIKTLSFHAFGDLPTERPLVFKRKVPEDGRIIEHCWLLLEHGPVRKCEWNDGRVELSRASSRDFPFLLTKTLIRDFFEGKEVKADAFYVERDVLHQCLQDFDLLDFDEDDPGLLEGSGRPLIFQMTGTLHFCQENSNGRCKCLEEFVDLCFVSENEKVTYISWIDGFLSFTDEPDPDELPPALKTMRMLEYYLQLPWKSNGCEVRWYGSSEDFFAYFEDYEVMDFKHDGPLPKTRPLVFKKDNSSVDETVVFWLLREDGVVIRCEHYGSDAILSIDPPSSLPPVLSKSASPR